jgi:hypothetical protein
MSEGDMDQKDAYSAMFDMTLGFIRSHCLNVAGELHIADHLVSGPKSVEELAELSDSKPEPLYRLLRFLAGHGLFKEENGRRFALTPMSELLVSDHPFSFSAASKFIGYEFEAFCDLIVAVKDDKSPFEKRYGTTLFEYMMPKPELLALAEDTWKGIHGPETQAILDAYDFAGVEQLNDIGGGHGDLVSQALQQYPSMRGVLFDLPDVVERSSGSMAATGVSERCEFVGGNFFEDVPINEGTFILRHILHDWDDQKCEAILRNIATDCAVGTRVLIAETVVAGRNEPDVGKMFDVAMMGLLPGGKERTEDEYGALLRAAGFELTNITPTESVVSVVEARLAS